MNACDDLRLEHDESDSLEKMGCISLPRSMLEPADSSGKNQVVAEAKAEGADGMANGKGRARASLPLGCVCWTTRSLGRMPVCSFVGSTVVNLQGMTAGVAVAILEPR